MSGPAPGGGTRINGGLDRMGAKVGKERIVWLAVKLVLIATWLLGTNRLLAEQR